MDKVEIRRRNLVGKSAMPYALGLKTLGTQIVYDSGDYACCYSTKTLKQSVGLSFRSSSANAARRARKSVRVRRCSVEKSGLGPFDTVRVEIRPDGIVEVITGVASTRTRRGNRDRTDLRRCARR